MPRIKMDDVDGGLRPPATENMGGEPKPAVREPKMVTLKHHSVTVGVIIIDGLSIPWTGVQVPLARAKQIVGIRTAQLQKRAARAGVKPDACDIFYE